MKDKSPPPEAPKLTKADFKLIKNEKYRPPRKFKPRVRFNRRDLPPAA